MIATSIRRKLLHIKFVTYRYYPVEMEKKQST